MKRFLILVLVVFVILVASSVGCQSKIVEVTRIVEATVVVEKKVEVVKEVVVTVTPKPTPTPTTTPLVVEVTREVTRVVTVAPSTQVPTPIAIVPSTKKAATAVGAILQRVEVIGLTQDERNCSHWEVGKLIFPVLEGEQILQLPAGTKEFAFKGDASGHCPWDWVTPKFDPDHIKVRPGEVILLEFAPIASGGPAPTHTWCNEETLTPPCVQPTTRIPPTPTREPPPW